ncbi:MAG: DUF4835 family protein [Flavobacterium psychrophilum]
MRNYWIILVLIWISSVSAQELNCTVKVNAEQIAGTNKQVFKTLEKALNDFVNKTEWTGQEYKANERINCSMNINVTEFDTNRFKATIQVESSRPVYNSTYSSPVFNFNDKEFSFDYIEFQILNFNPTSFDSNLVSVISFYSFIIIGLDADTFALNGGSNYLENAREILTTAQGSNYKGWNQGESNQNRYFLLTDLLSQTYASYREALFQYHFEGLDTMHQDSKGAKDKIVEAVKNVTDLYKVRPNAFLMRVFFDAKVDEMVSLFSGGPKMNVAELIGTLNQVSPINAAKWATIKY